MRLLLDENLPKRLKEDLSAHEVYTVRDMGWSGIKNGALLKLMLEKGFDAMLTFDKNLQHQQNFSTYPITVFVLVAPINRYSVLTELSPFVIAHLTENSRKVGAIVI